MNGVVYYSKNNEVNFTMDKLILDAEDVDLSGRDIKRMVDGKTNIMAYEQLKTYSNLEQVLSPYGSCVLLYQTTENYGHWVVLIDRGNKMLEFYDSYGLAPDEELKLDNQFHLRIHGGKITPHLGALIQAGGWSVKYNHEQLQEQLSDINTCGRYCVMRLIYKDLSIRKFNDLLTKNKYYHPDFWVSAMTYFI